MPASAVKASRRVWLNVGMVVGFSVAIFIFRQVPDAQRAQASTLLDAALPAARADKVVMTQAVRRSSGGNTTCVVVGCHSRGTPGVEA